MSPVLSQFYARLSSAGMIFLVCFLFLLVGAARVEKRMLDTGRATKHVTEMIASEPGTYWVYSYKTREQTAEGMQQKDTKVKYTVRDTIQSNQVIASLIEVTDLSDQSRSYSIRLTFNNSRLFEIDGSDRSEAEIKKQWSTLKQSIASGNRVPQPTEDELQMELPARIGMSWDSMSDVPRDDNWYCWSVEAIREIDSRKILSGALLEGIEARVSTEYTLAFRTCPDHQIKKYVPVVGFTDIDYEHHGTIIETHQHLLEFHRTRVH